MEIICKCFDLWMHLHAEVYVCVHVLNGCKPCVNAHACAHVCVHAHLNVYARQHTKIGSPAFNVTCNITKFCVYSICVCLCVLCVYVLIC